MKPTGSDRAEPARKRRPRKRRGRGAGKHADVIAFANQKGGVAKTTTTLNLAVAFAETGHRVLCIDLDPQGNLTMSQGIDPDKVEKSLYDVLVNDMPISEIIQHREIDIAVASIDLAGAEIAMSTKIGRERSLEKALKEVSGDYDFVCIDTPPSLGLLTINALTAATKVIVPVQCEYLSMRGLVQLQNTLKMIQENLNPDVRIEGILPTMLDSRTVHAKEAVEILEENFGDLVFKSRIRKAIKFAEAPVKGASVLKYDSESNAASYYRDLAKEVLANELGVSGRACARVPSPISSARPPTTLRPTRRSSRLRARGPRRGKDTADEPEARARQRSGRRSQDVPPTEALGGRAPTPLPPAADAERAPTAAPSRVNESAPRRRPSASSESSTSSRSAQRAVSSSRSSKRRATGATSPPTSRQAAASRTNP